MCEFLSVFVNHVSHGVMCLCCVTQVSFTDLAMEFKGILGRIQREFPRPVKGSVTATVAARARLGENPAIGGRITIKWPLRVADHAGFHKQLAAHLTAQFGRVDTNSLADGLYGFSVKEMPFGARVLAHLAWVRRRHRLCVLRVCAVSVTAKILPAPLQTQVVEGFGSIEFNVAHQISRANLAKIGEVYRAIVTDMWADAVDSRAPDDIPRELKPSRVMGIGGTGGTASPRSAKSTDPLEVLATLGMTTYVAGAGEDMDWDCVAGLDDVRQVGLDVG